MICYLKVTNTRRNWNRIEGKENEGKYNENKGGSKDNLLFPCSNSFKISIRWLPSWAMPLLQPWKSHFTKHFLKILTNLTFQQIHAADTIVFLLTHKEV